MPRYPAAPEIGEAKVVESLVAHFLNVGHGDCTFIELPSGRLMMIDINNSKSLPETDKEALAAARESAPLSSPGPGLRLDRRSWQAASTSRCSVDPYVYYQGHFSGEPVFRYLQTHPDMDHMSGLHRFFWLEKVPLVNFWDVPHSKELGRGQLQPRALRLPGLAHLPAAEGGTRPEGSDGTPASHHVIKKHQARQGEFWTDDGIQVFSPTPELIAGCDDSEEFNDCSYVDQAQLRRAEHHPSRRCRGNRPGSRCSATSARARWPATS